MTTKNTSDVSNTHITHFTCLANAPKIKKIAMFHNFSAFLGLFGAILALHGCKNDINCHQNALRMPRRASKMPPKSSKRPQAVINNV